MAGHRRRSGRPLLEHQREQRRLQRLADRLAVATTPGEQLAAAFDFLRGGLKNADPDVAEHISADVVEYMRAAGRRAFDSRKRGAA